MTPNLPSAAAAVVVAAGLHAGAAEGSSLGSMQLASDLGTVLASEEACGLSYDQAAIARWIEERVPAEDMAFPGNLQLMTSGAEWSLGEMSVSAMTAHCVQVRRIARSYGFVVE